LNKKVLYAQTMRETTKRKALITFAIIMAVAVITGIILVVSAIGLFTQKSNSSYVPNTSSTSTETSSPTPTAPAPVEPAPAAPVVDVVDEFDIDGSYEREAFGTAWRDVDQNGCDTRNDILARDLTNLTYVDGGDCKINTGVLNDPYTATVINFQFGQGTSQKVQIDHMVPLMYAHYAGAKNWTEEQRIQFANDPENLLAVEGSANSSKSASGPSEWLPENTTYLCTYSQKFMNVVVKYDLTVTTADYAVLTEGLATC